MTFRLLPYRADIAPSPRHTVRRPALGTDRYRIDPPGATA